MTIDELLLRRILVFVSAIGYWGGVFIQARRVRKRIGRSPNLKPRGAKERLLWLGWFVVILGWICLPLFARPGADGPWFRPDPALLGTAGCVTGALLLVAGYAGTLWCYAAMGDHWRIGVDRRQTGTLVKTGPYRVIRHPIYLFQMVMLAGVVFLLPTLFPLFLLALHIVCALLKAWDEESHLLKTHGPVYEEYLRQTGMLLPPVAKRRD